MNARRLLGRAVVLALLLFGAVLVLTPFFWMVSLSFKTQAEIFSPTIALFPEQLRWDNYVAAFERTTLLRFLLNGMIVCGGILFFQVLFALPCAYALAQRRFRRHIMVPEKNPGATDSV